MDVQGKVGVVTGASSGIGKSIAEEMVKAGMKVVGCGRDLKKLQEVADEFSSKYSGEMKAVKCDVGIEQDIYNLFKFVDDTYGSLYACINNAAFSTEQPILTGDIQIWRKMLDVNVLGVAICSREAIKLMKKYNITNGIVININSLSGHKVAHYNPTHFYAATKFAVTALTEGIRQELRLEKCNIRTVNLCPGVVQTDFHFKMFPGETERAASHYNKFRVLDGKDIADAAMYALKAPDHVQLCDLIIRPTEQTV